MEKTWQATVSGYAEVITCVRSLLNVNIDDRPFHVVSIRIILSVSC